MQYPSTGISEWHQLIHTWDKEIGYNPLYPKYVCLFCPTYLFGVCRTKKSKFHIFGVNIYFMGNFYMKYECHISTVKPG